MSANPSVVNLPMQKLERAAQRQLEECRGKLDWDHDLYLKCKDSNTSVGSVISIT